MVVVHDVEVLGTKWDIECEQGVLVVFVSSRVLVAVLLSLEVTDWPREVAIDDIVVVSDASLFGDSENVGTVVLFGHIGMPSTMQGWSGVGQVKEGSVGNGAIEVSIVCVSAMTMVLVSLATAAVESSLSGEASALASSRKVLSIV
jgi:hypothetical protein